MPPVCSFCWSWKRSITWPASSGGPGGGSCAAPPGDDKFLGKIRLEAATGEDFSDVVNIPKPDGMMERALQFVKWLAHENPLGRWEYFLTDDRQGLRWDRVIMAGSSHGATTPRSDSWSRSCSH